MLLHSWSFALALAVFLPLYHALRRPAQNALLLLGSYLFLAAFDLRFLGVLWAYTLVNYLGARLIARAKGRARRGWLLAVLALDLGGLTVFKYYDFFLASAVKLVTALGLTAHPHTLGLILPVGISFYTFMCVGYCVDVYRGQARAEGRPEGNLAHLALFLGFFPLLSAGPIERAGRLLPQFKGERLMDGRTLLSGGFLILMGLTRKVAIADVLAPRVDAAFADPSGASSLTLATAMFMYALQLYGDFSGYTDMARGVARLLGIELTRNFDQPYFALSIAEFWRRWHMSLSSWFRDYLYIPLGGGRVATPLVLRNYLVTMLLCGLWHGPAWTFIVWGGLHGLALCLHRLWRGVSRRLSPPAWLRPLSAGCAWLATFAFVCLAWVFFRAPDLGTAWSFLQGMFALRGAWEPGLIKLPALAAALLLFLDLPQTRGRGHEAMLSWPRPLTALALALMLLAVLLAPSPAAQKAFIYLQF